MENLQQQLEELRNSARDQFESSFSDGLHAQIYNEWSGIMKHTDLNPYTKVILMRLVEMKWRCEFNFTVTQLSKELKINKKSVLNHVKIIEEMGLCKKFEHSYVYQITFNKVF